MKLNLVFGDSKKLLEELCAIPMTRCDLGGNCMENKIRAMIADFEEKHKEGTCSDIFARHAKFFLAATYAYSDGRACPGPEMLDRVKKLQSDGWKKDLGIVTAGIRFGVIDLEQHDLDKLAM